MKKKQNSILILYGIEIFIALLFVAVLPRFDLDTSTSLFGFPFLHIGLILRYLSLKGLLLNIFAWIIYLFLSIIPILIYFFLRYKKKTQKLDILLILFSIFLFILNYYSINPSLLNSFISNVALLTFKESSIIILSFTYHSLFISYLVIRLITHSSKMNTNNIIYYLRYFLYIFNSVLIFIIFFVNMSELITTLKSMESLSITYFLLILRFIINNLSNLATILLIHITTDILKEMAINDYSAALIHKTNSLSKFCRSSLFFVMISIAFYNVLSLLFINQNLNSFFYLNIPISYIGLSITLLLISKRFTLSHAIKEENDLFI